MDGRRVRDTDMNSRDPSQEDFDYKRKMQSQRVAAASKLSGSSESIQKAHASASKLALFFIGLLAFTSLVLNVFLLFHVEPPSKRAADLQLSVDALKLKISSLTERLNEVEKQNASLKRGLKP